MSTHDDADPMSPHGDVDVVADADWRTDVDYLLVRARCCRDWPVLAWTRMGRCGYCGEVPVVIGPW